NDWNDPELAGHRTAARPRTGGRSLRGPVAVRAVPAARRGPGALPHVHRAALCHGAGGPGRRPGRAVAAPRRAPRGRGAGGAVLGLRRLRGGAPELAAVV